MAVGSSTLSRLMCSTGLRYNCYRQMMPISDLTAQFKLLHRGVLSSDYQKIIDFGDS
jgi:hypothetical protein